LIKRITKASLLFSLMSRVFAPYTKDEVHAAAASPKDGLLYVSNKGKGRKSNTMLKLLQKRNFMLIPE